MKKLFAGLIMLLLAASVVNAAEKWQSISFTEDLAKGFEELAAHCSAHGVTVNDVLQANHIESEDIKAGAKIYLPNNKADVLAIWQHIGAWQPRGLVTLNSGIAARRLLKNKQPEEPAKTTPVAEKAAEPVKVAAAETKPETEKAEEPVKVAAAETKPDTKPTPKKSVAAKSKTAKPDKVLTAKRKSSQPDIPGLMDPIIVLSPTGGKANGPMRLVISGDKVEVVKLPQNALPRRPSAEDINAPFTSGYSYLSFYSALGKPRNGSNNNVMTNLTSLGGKMLWPVDGRISSPFGRWRGKHKHEGIDIPMPGGTPIRAAKNGVVIRTGNNSTIGFRGYGNFVMVDHGGNVRTFYAHCSRVAVVEGQRVMQGQVIAYVGNTGHSTANHLHFEVRINNTKVNPIPYLAGSTHLANK